MSIRPRFLGAFVVCVTVLAAPVNTVSARTPSRHAGASQAASRHGVDVRAVRLSAGPDNTRIVLDLSGSAQHSLAVLSSPDRVVLDVPGARLGPGARAPDAIGAIKQVRMAKRLSGELRTLFHLSRPAPPKPFLPAPH